MNKMNYSSLLLIAIMSQQIMPVSDSQLGFVSNNLPGKPSRDDIKRVVPNWAALANPMDVVAAYKAAQAAKAAPAPAATPPVAPVAPSVQTPKTPAAQHAPAPATTIAGVDAQLKQMQGEIDRLNKENFDITHNLQAEVQTHERTKNQLRDARKVADAVAGMSNEAIAGAAQDLIDRSGVNADKTAGKAVLAKLGSLRQSHTLGRLGSAHKQNQKRNNRYAH